MEVSEAGRKWLWGGGAVAVVGAAVLLWLAFREPPQMGADPKVFETVDALYTAVRMKDEAKLADCERRLKGYRESGALPRKPADYLDGVVKTARGGSWQAAAERLYGFMRVQRRDGAG